MKRVLSILLFAALPSAALAKNPIPEGEYVVGDTILRAGIDAGIIVPVFVHITSYGETLSVAFITSYRPDQRLCADTNNCKRVDQALDLDVTEKDGRLVVTDSRVTLDDVIDREVHDRGWIIVPTQIFIDGAAVSTGDDPAVPGMVTLTKRDGRRARLVPASLAFTEDAIDFAKTTDMSLGGFESCIVRQVAQAAARDAADETDKAIAGAARHAGRVERLVARTRAADPKPAEGSPERHEQIMLIMLRFAGRPKAGSAATTPREALEGNIGDAAESMAGEDYEMLLGRAFDGHEAEIMAYRAWKTRFDAAREQLGSNEALVERLCKDVTLAR